MFKSKICCYNCGNKLEPNKNNWNILPYKDGEIEVCDNCYEDWYIK